MRILTLLATFTKISNIVEIIKEEFNVTFSYNDIYWLNHCEDHKKTIAKIRERWTEDIQNIELCNKRRRLEELSKIYEKCFETNQMKNALKAIDQIHDEVEKASNFIQQQNNYQVNIYKEMSESEIEEERLKILDRIKTIKQITSEVPKETIEVKEV
jgi:hypothetical protein